LRKIAAYLFLIVGLFISCENNSAPRHQENISANEHTEIQKAFERIASQEHRYRQDGSTFQNREHRLPEMPYGYYKEYTVETPGSQDRGARRLILASGGEAYYTNDHYNTFIKIDRKDYE